MQWIVLVAGSRRLYDRITSMAFPGHVTRYGVTETRYFVDFGADHVFVDDDPMGLISGDYDPGQLEVLPFSHPHLVMIVYTSEARMRDIVTANDFPRGVFVDNGFGLIVPVEEFVALGLPMDPDRHACDSSRGGAS